MAFTVGPLHNPGVTALGLRQHLRQGGGLQPGVLAASHFKVTQSTPSADAAVRVAAGLAVVGGGTDDLYTVTSSAVATTITGGAVGHGSLPRIDSVILKVLDKVQYGSASDGVQIIIRQGTATAGATLDNRTGAPSVSVSGELLLADMLQPTGSVGYTTANIRDRRPHARGFSGLILGNGAGNITTTSTTDVAATSHNAPRVEITAGNAVKVTGSTSMSTTAGTAVARVRIASSNPAVTAYTPTAGAVGTNVITAPLSGVPITAASGGSYVATLLWSNNVAGTATMQNGATIFTAIGVEEIVGGLKDNS